MEKKSKKNIIIGMSVLLLVVITLLGLTYAYYRTRVIGNPNNESISVTSKLLQLTYNDDSANIDLSGIEPSNETEYTKTFRVTNTGDTTITNYGVYLENVINSFELKSDLVYTLSCTSYANYGETNQAVSGTCNGIASQSTFPSVVTKIVTNNIDAGITHEYTLTLKYLETGEDQSVDMGKTLKAKINIYDSETKFLASEIVSNALLEKNGTKYVATPFLSFGKGEGELVDVSERIDYNIIFSELSEEVVVYSSNKALVDRLINSENNDFFNTCFIIDEENETMTPTFAEGCGDLNALPTTCDDINNKYIYYFGLESINEAVYVNSCSKDGIIILAGKKALSNANTLSYTMDDYGTSYYYRGNVYDNYVNFSGMCWRILRIEGNGNIKLILADENNLCDSNNYSIYNENSAFINEGEAFYYGWEPMSGITVKELRDSWGSYENSVIYDNLDKWLLNKKIDNSKLIDSKWCSDNSINNHVVCDVGNDEAWGRCGEDFYHTENTSFKAENRLTGEVVNPSLKCDSSITPIIKNIGIITADEAVFAGAHNYNNNYFLKTNAKSAYWTMTYKSASNGSGRGTEVSPQYTEEMDLYTLNEDGLLSFSGYSYTDDRLGTWYGGSDMAIRPSVVLNKNVRVIKGEGTQTSPYIIN